jgi:hypothetical protein
VVSFRRGAFTIVDMLAKPSGPRTGGLDDLHDQARAEDGTPAEPPSIKTAVTNWRPRAKS